MIVLLDPLLFEVDAGLEARLNGAAAICRAVGARIPKDTAYWLQFSRNVIEPARRSGSPNVRRACDRLILHAVKLGLPQPARVLATIAGVGTLLGSDWGAWQVCVDDALTRCAAAPEDACWIVRLVEGRNLHSRVENDAELRAKIPWNVTVSLGSASERVFPCLHSLRNVALPWTTRYDERLPAQQDRARFPFCPDPTWRSSATLVSRTVRKRPAWIDARRNGWSIGTLSQHWDVVLVPAVEAVVGLDQINVTPFGTPGVSPGELDHVPRKKKQALKDDSGWRCE